MNTNLNFSTIVYATDLGDHLLPVSRQALALAKQYGARIIWLHVVEPISQSTLSVINTYLSLELTDDVQKEAMKKVIVSMRERLRQFYDAECVDDKQAAVVNELFVVAGRPSEEILRVTEEDKADIIVMGKSTKKVRGIRVHGSNRQKDRQNGQSSGSGCPQLLHGNGRQ